jgi:RNA polymerase primary sigma factor
MALTLLGRLGRAGFMARNRDSLGSYMEEVSRVALLSPEEERALARRARDGDNEARNRLVEANLRFVIKIAKGYVNQGLPFQDLIQEGNIGLMEAIKRFDPEKGFRLTTYASWWINLHIQRSLQMRARPIKLPINKLESLRRIKAFVADHYREHGKNPSVEKVAHGLGYSVAKVEQIMSYDVSFVSLDTPVGEDGATLEGLVADPKTERPEWTVYVDQLRNGLGKVMSVLTQRERKVIERRFGIGRPAGELASLRQIGQEIGLSAEGVRRVEQQALRKLRRHRIQAVLRSVL